MVEREAPVAWTLDDLDLLEWAEKTRPHMHTEWGYRDRQGKTYLLGDIGEDNARKTCQHGGYTLLSREVTAWNEVDRD